MRNYILTALAIVGLGLSILLTYTVFPDSPFYDVAERSVTPVEKSAQTADSEDSDPIVAGQTQEMSDDDPGNPIPQSLGIDDMDHRLPVDAPLRGDPKLRDRLTYDNVINQFAVKENPRYQLRENDKMYETGVTYCNTFVWDVTRAMGAEIPYWVDENGKLTEPWFSDKGHWRVWDPSYWRTANEINQWLKQNSQQSGWHSVTAEEAQDAANLGFPTVVSMYILDGPGHIGIVRPGEELNGPALAQAGTTNVNHAHVYDFFPREGTQFFTHS